MDEAEERANETDKRLHRVSLSMYNVLRSVTTGPAEALLTLQEAAAMIMFSSNDQDDTLDEATMSAFTEGLRLLLQMYRQTTKGVSSAEQ